MSTIASLRTKVAVWHCGQGGAREQMEFMCTCTGGTHSYCRCVAFSPDGGQLVSGSDDNNVRLWNMQTGALFAGHEGHHKRVIFGRILNGWDFVASGSLDSTVRIWNAVTGLQVGEYTGHSGAARCVAFSADGLRIASALLMKSMCGLLVRPPVCNGTQSTWLCAVAGISPANRLAVASEDGSIRIWVRKSGSCIEQHDLGKPIITFAMAPGRESLRCPQQRES